MREIDRDRLAGDLAAAGIELKPEAIDRLWKFHNILRAKNRELNLTRLYSYDTIVRKHYVDCLIVGSLFKKHGLQWKGPVMDLGSGGGFPGIPMAIQHPELEWYLVEGREHRCSYLAATAEELGLSNVHVFWRKLQGHDSIPVGAVITRAVEGMSATTFRVESSLERNGYLVFMKGPYCDAEIGEMQGLPYDLLLDEHYTLPGADSVDRRRLVVFSRKADRPPGRQIHSYGEMAEQWKAALQLTSSENPRYKSLKKILQGGARAVQKEGRTLVYGRKVVSEVLNESPEQVEAILVEERDVRQGKLDSGALPAGIDVWLLSGALIEGLGLRGFDPPYLLYRTAPIPRWDPAANCDGPVLFLPLGDPENLGLALRSALAFGIENVVLLEEAALPYLPSVIRASSGGSLRLSYSRGPSLLNLSEHLPAIPLYYLDREGMPLSSVSVPDGPFGLLVGEEGRGIPDSLRARSGEDGMFPVSIPISESIDSLNAAVSLSIALYHLRQQG